MGKNRQRLVPVVKGFEVEQLRFAPVVDKRHVDICDWPTPLEGSVCPKHRAGCVLRHIAEPFHESSGPYEIAALLRRAIGVGAASWVGSDDAESWDIQRLDQAPEGGSHRISVALGRGLDEFEGWLGAAGKFSKLVLEEQ